MALSTSPKRVAFDVNNVLIETLLVPFAKKGFDKLVKTTGKAAPYKLPDIVFSGKKRIADYDVVAHQQEEELGKETRRIGLLGCYVYDISNPYKEGTVIIYYEAIWKTIKAYLFANPSVTSNSDECFEALVNVVTLHELVHWLMHHVMGFAPIKYSDREEIYFHEGFVQLFTWLTIKKVEGAEGELMRNLFLWLAAKQPPAYRKYKELTEVNSEELITIAKAIELLKTCRGYNPELAQCFSLAVAVIRILSFKEGEVFRRNDKDYMIIFNFYKKDVAFEGFYKYLPKDIQAKRRGFQALRKYGL